MKIQIFGYVKNQKEKEELLARYSDHEIEDHIEITGQNSHINGFNKNVS